MIRIIQIDGGGGKIVIPMTILSEMEKALGPGLHRRIDLVGGASAGGLCSTILASGRISMVDAARVTEDVVSDTFKWRPRMPYFQPKYDRERILRPVSAILGHISMSLLKTRCMITSVLVNDRPHNGPWPHFFKSWEQGDGKLPVRTALARTFAAPLYFGYVNEPEYKQTWADGGCGLDNCTLDYIWKEMGRQDWLRKRVHVLSIGCGYSDRFKPYSVTSRWKVPQQIWSFGDIPQGGMARMMSMTDQVEDFRHNISLFPSISFQRIDVSLPKNLDCMDGARYIKEYREIGKSIAKTVDLSAFR